MLSEEKLSAHMERVQGPASYWIDEVKQLESSRALAYDNCATYIEALIGARKEIEAYKWFICKIPLRQFDEIMNDVPEEYRRTFILTKEEYDALKAGEDEKIT